MGTEVFPVESGSQTLKDATNEAMREWMSTRRGHALHHRQRGRPAPVPDDGPRLPERHRRRRRSSSACEQVGKLPDVVVACVGGGSNAAGMFYPFVDDAGVELVGVEAGGRGGEARRARGHAQQRQAGRAARQLQLRPAGRRRPDGRVHSVSAGPGLPRRRPGAQLLARREPRAVLQRHRQGGARRASTCAAGWRASCRRWRRRTRWSRRCGSRRSGRRTTWWWCASRGRGDKDCAEVARLTAKK